MKKLFKPIYLALTLALSLCFGFAGCGKNEKTDITLNEDGDIVGESTAYIDFWGWGDPEEVEVFKALTERFNSENPKIVVTYIQKPSDGYSGATAQALSGRSGPDVVYVGDGDLKSWASLDLLAPMDDYLKTSKVIDVNDIWDSALGRYRFDKATQQSRPTDPLFAVPKDIGPTVIYYNKSVLSAVGVDEISVFAEDIAAYNTANGKAYPASGFFLLDGSNNVMPINDTSVSVDTVKSASKRIFNNKIPMTWEESIALFKLMTKSYNSASPADYGYFTEWWFNYGWSVGGDCITYDGEKWVFSLGDTTQRYNNNGVISTTQEDGGLPLPTTLDAFTHFVQLSQPKTTDVDGSGHYGFAVTPSPDTLSTMGKSGYFTGGKVAMMVDGRWATVTYRKNIKSFDWDVAPLPKAKNGIEAGHSGSMGMAINAKSKVKNAAWKFCEFIAGSVGQSAQAETGFNIPNQKSIANTDLFLQPDKKPANSTIFLNAARVQRAGDWAYLSDGLWIEEWAPVLNDDVRNQKKNLTQFFAEVTDRTNAALLKY
ncbi:MAG: extracellular solute-binding protein [Clostridiales bacterium]|jgi:multiple sugar transport system substrate-binding protein|nr:extracellular solute-binding protein [Clostridiales bacterium]